MTQVDLNLSSAQARKLWKGEGILLKHLQIGEGGKRFHLPEHIVKKLHSAKRRRKGMRIHLSDKDREVSGGSVQSFFRNKVLPVYQAKVAPVVRQGLKDVANAAAGALGEAVAGPGGAMLAQQATPYINQAVDYVGNTTGGFGIRRRVPASKRAPATNSHHLLHPEFHPAMHPIMGGLPDFSRPDFVHSGMSAREKAPPKTVGRRRKVVGGSFLTG
jgi:hypothetical protein